MSEELLSSETATAVATRRFVHVHFSDGAAPVVCDPGNVEIGANDFCVIQEADGGERVGFVTGPAVLCEHQYKERDLPRIVRRAQPADVRGWHFLRRRESEAMVVCKAMVQKHKLEMKITRARFEDRQHKIVFYFTADKRVDFRDLVKDLAVHFRARIELWQVGVRDEAKTCGGLGCCGRPMCCATWMRDFIPVSIRYAKSQDIQFSPTKLAGVCGRLRCCLAYEQEQYAEMGRGVPAIGCVTESDEFGRGKIVDRNLLTHTATVTTEEGKYVVLPLNRLRRLQPGEEAKFVKPGQNPAKVWRVMREGEVAQAADGTDGEEAAADAADATTVEATPWQYDERRPGLEDDEEQPDAMADDGSEDGKEPDGQPGTGKPRRRRRRGRRSKGGDKNGEEQAAATAPAAPQQSKAGNRGSRRPHGADRPPQQQQQQQSQGGKAQARQGERRTAENKPPRPPQQGRHK